MADIAAQKAFQAVFKLGAGILTVALMGPTVNPTQYSSPIGPGMEGMPGGAFTAFQHGGTVHAPTLALLGERGTEHVVPDAAMQAMLSGGQGGQRPPINLSVINVANQAQADQAKAQAEARGHEAIIVNAVNSNLSRGEDSSILRTLRTLQR